MTDLNNITRFHIADSIHNEFGLPKKDCNDLVSDIIDIIVDGLQNYGRVKIHNFGTFIVKNKKSRIGRNPKTKEEVMIGERKVISFKASKNVLKYLNSFNEKE
ncbi:integration host factor subunit alpha [Pelagibacteraceae bacterium]|nr:integration host factor subunit alpha [Pelagibacteraceae bacterium]